MPFLYLKIARFFTIFQPMKQFLRMYLALIFWPAATACWIYFVSNYQYFFYYQLALMMAYLIQPWWFGGFEFLTASVSKAFRLEDKKVA